MPIGSGISFIMAILVFLNDATDNFVYFDTINALLLLSLFLFRRKLNINVKVLVCVAITYILGVLSIVNDGFSGTGIVLLMLSNLIVTGFLSKKIGTYFSILTTLTLSIIPILVKIHYITYAGYNSYLLNNNSEWTVHIGTLALCLLVLNIMINSIHGNKMGDDLLKNISQNFKKFTLIDNLARISGNEYAWWIDTVSENESDYRISTLIKAIIQLKDLYGFNIVAEGVETQEQCDAISKLGFVI